jgi:hypothetical protein
MRTLVMETLATDASEYSAVDAADHRAGSGANAVPKAPDLVAVEPCPGSANPVEEPKTKTDLVSKLVQEIESLSRPDAFARLTDMLEKLNTLEAAREQSFFEIGGMLSIILKNAWFDPYPSFDKWAQACLGMRRAKARALIRNYDVVAKAGLSAAQFERIGWTKIRELAPVLRRDNAERWSERAATHSRAQLKQLVKQQMSPPSALARNGSPGTLASVASNGAQRQAAVKAIEKAKLASKATSDATALTPVCPSYGGAQPLQERLAEAGPEAAIVAVVDFVSGLDEPAAGPLLRRLMYMAQQALGAARGWQVSKEIEAANREFRARLPG